MAPKVEASLNSVVGLKNQEILWAHGNAGEQSVVVLISLRLHNFLSKRLVEMLGLSILATFGDGV